MPTALELLSTEACDDILVVNLETREIIIPKNVSILGVEADDETRILHFQVPRYYCNVDLSEFAIRVNYRNAKGEGDMYIVTETLIEDDMIRFDWVVGRNAFAKKGNVTCFRKRITSFFCLFATAEHTKHRTSRARHQNPFGRGAAEDLLNGIDTRYDVLEPVI